MKSNTLIAVLLAILSLSACTASPTRSDATFGHSLQTMLRDQIYNPRAAEHAAHPAPADGQRLEKVLKAHRDDVAHASDQVAKPVQIDTGNQ